MINYISYVQQFCRTFLLDK